MRQIQKALAAMALAAAFTAGGMFAAPVQAEAAQSVAVEDSDAAAVSAVTAQDKDIALSSTTVKLSRTAFSLKVGSTKTLTVKGTTKTPTWSSSSKTVATVSKSGKVTAKKPGYTMITAKIGTKTYTCDVIIRGTAAQNASSLKKYFVKHGCAKLSDKTTTDEGDVYYWSIRYSSSSDLFTLTEKVTADNAVYQMTVKSSTLKALTCSYTDGTEAGPYKMKVSTASYNPDKRYSFVSDAGVKADSDQRSVANSILKLGMKADWNVLLNDNTGLILQDLGFTFD